MKRIWILVAAAAAAAACDRPEPFAPAGWRATGLTAGPLFSTTFDANISRVLLPDVSNVFQGQSGSGDINGSGWIAGSTTGVFDGGFVSSTRATLWTPDGVAIDLGTLPSPGLAQPRAWAHGINDAGTVTGYGHGPRADGLCCVFRAFVWTAGAGMQALPLLASTTSASAHAFGINQAGHVAGVATDAAGISHAVVWYAHDEAPVPLTGLSGSSAAAAINDVGQVIGNDALGAFIWTPGSGPQYLGELGGGWTIAYGINNHGHVVGYSPTPDGVHHPFLWTPGGGMQNLGLPPGATHAEARDINDAGRIVVSTVDVDPASSHILMRPFLRVEDSWFELPSSSLAGATAINENTQVAGYDTPGSFGQAARWDVILTPAAQPFDFDGFFAPIANLPTVNRVKAGQAVPVKFSLGGDHGLDIFAPGYPASQPIPCDAGAPTDAIEETATAGGSSLTYDPTTGRYTYVWKTERGWSGSCRRLIVELVDGSRREAHFAFTR